MAILKALGGSKARGSCNDSLNYITKEEKTEQNLVYTKDCSEDNFKKDFEETKQIWNKTEGRQYFHLVQSFEKEDYVTLDKAHEIGKKFIENNPQFKDFQIVMATHQDKDHIHNHFVINSVGLDEGKKFQMYKADLKQCKELSNEICRDYGFKELDLKIDKEKNLQENTERYSLTEKALVENDKTSWKNELRKKLDNCLEFSRDFEEFKENLKKENIEISRGAERTDDKIPKTITFVFQEKKVRGNKLDTRYENLNSIEKSLEIEKSKINLQTLVNQNKVENNTSDKLKELLNTFKPKEQEPAKNQSKERPKQNSRVNER